MASLLERIGGVSSNGSVGPVRSRGGRAISAPYEKPGKPGNSKADADSIWKHDKYTGPGKTLGSRLSDTSITPKIGTSVAALALRQAMGLDSRRSSGANLSIKGASSVSSNVVQVENLASGTTAADVEAIFKRCGPVLASYIHGPKNADKVTVRIKFINPDDAKRAVDEFHGKSADGNILNVTVVGGSEGPSASLRERIDGTSTNDTVDVLMQDASETSGGSKMRSDELLSDPRAQVLTVPPGIDPAKYGERESRRGKGRGKPGRGFAMRMRRNGLAMLVD